MDAFDALIKIASPEIRLEAYHAFEGEYSSTRKKNLNNCCSLIFVLEGGCGIQLPDEDAIWLSAGDFLLVNNNDEYRLVSLGIESQDTALIGAVGAVEIDMMNRHTVGESKILCAAVTGATGAAVAFFKLLPDRLLLPSSVVSPTSAALRITKMLRSEISENGGGPRPIMESFVKCGLVLALREMILLKYSRCGLVSLCGHPTLSRYLGSIVEDPRRGWSLDSSEGAYHEFSEAQVIEVSGFSAATILSVLRVLMSFPLLATSKKTILQIGVTVGFNSAAEFSKVFIDCVGGPPASFRITRISSLFP